MKIAFFFVSFLALINLHAQNHKVNIDKSTIEWKAYKVTGSHTGTISILEASIDINAAGELRGANVSIDMGSILVTDIDGNGKIKLEGHLKSDDFFGVEKYPTSSLEINDVGPGRRESEYQLTANLTIKDITVSKIFYATIKEKLITATLEIDRSKYNVQYGSGSFFDNLGNKLIYDLFELEVTLVMD